jgi:hypothetical protein
MSFSRKSLREIPKDELRRSGVCSLSYSCNLFPNEYSHRAKKHITLPSTRWLIFLKATRPPCCKA